MTTYSESDKLQYEVMKLIAEERNLSRAFWRQPTSWITAVTLGLSVIGNTVQYSSAERKEQLATLRKEKLDLESAKLADKELALKASTGALADRQTELTADVNAKLQRLAEVSQQISAIEQQVASKQADLDAQRITPDAFAIAFKDNAQKLRSIAASTAQDLEKPLDKARANELAGFNALTREDFGAALAAFQAAENAVNGYHHAYELARLLRQQSKDFDNKDKRKEILRTIVANYYGYVPPEQLLRLRELAK